MELHELALPGPTLCPWEPVVSSHTSQLDHAFEERRRLRQGICAHHVHHFFDLENADSVFLVYEREDQIPVLQDSRSYLSGFQKHCHNTHHEEHSMLLRWEIEQLIPAPMRSPGMRWNMSIPLRFQRSGTTMEQDHRLNSGD